MRTITQLDAIISQEAASANQDGKEQDVRVNVNRACMDQGVIRYAHATTDHPAIKTKGNATVNGATPDQDAAFNVLKASLDSTAIRIARRVKILNQDATM